MCTNAGGPNFLLWRQISVGSSVWDLRNVTLLEPWILRWFLDLWKIFVLYYGTKLNSELVSISCVCSWCRIFHISLSKPFCSWIRPWFPVERLFPEYDALFPNISCKQLNLRSRSFIVIVIHLRMLTLAWPVCHRTYGEYFCKFINRQWRVVQNCICVCMWAGIAHLVKRLATGWTVRGSNPSVGEIFRTSPDRPLVPPSLLYSG